MADVSVIIPIYNAERYLHRCVDSLLAQTLKSLEIILVDDGSPDGCGAICDAYAAAHSNVRVIHKPNAGQGLARNAGLEIAAGTYVGFMDADDYAAEDMFEALYRAAAEENADMAMGGYTFVGGIMYDHPTVEGTKHCFSEKTVFSGTEQMRRLLMGIIGAPPEDPEDSRYGHACWKNIYRRSLLLEKNIRFVSERQLISEDLVFLIDFTRNASRAVGIPGAYYYYCRNSGSFSKARKADRFSRFLTLLDAVEQRIPGDVEPEMKQLYLDRFFQSWARVCCTNELQYFLSENTPYRQWKSALQTICGNPRLKAALRRYPWHKLPFMQAFFAFTMRFELYRLQMLLLKLRQKLHR